jgi:hypothetical protein
MGWLSQKTTNEAAKTSAHPEKYGFDVSVGLRLRGMGAPVQATVMHIALAGCRLRSWMHMERGTAVGFDFPLPDGRVISVNGVVESARQVQNGVGHEYMVALEPLPDDQADALSRESARLARHSAASRSYDTTLVTASHFAGARVARDFSIAYRVSDPRATQRIGTGCDVNGIGLRLICNEQLREGEVLTLQFTLPHPGHHTHRKFAAQVKVKARVARCIKDSRKRDAYDLDFVEIGGMAREEISKYIHAHQNSKTKQ